jgi:hypothetical protein
MRSATTTAAALFTLAACTVACVPEGFISLKEPRFHASGGGWITTHGSTEPGSTVLSVEDGWSWEVGHGIRVRRAGTSVAVQTDAGWEASPTAGGAATASHPVSGGVVCEITGPLHGVDACAGPTDPAGGFVRFIRDELRVGLSVSAPVAEGALAIVFHALDAKTQTIQQVAGGELALPALAPGSTHRIFLPIRGKAGLNAVRRLSLRCLVPCDDLRISLHELELVDDLVAKVSEIGADGRTFFLDFPAERSVTGETVFHDDTDAIRTWLAEAEGGGAQLFAPIGVYYFGRRNAPEFEPTRQTTPLVVRANTHLRCMPGLEVDRPLAIFRNNGGAATGTSTFLSSPNPTQGVPSNVTIEDCGFDSNGWNREDFLSVVNLGGTAEDRIRDVRIRRSHFFDSVFDPGVVGDADCDHGQDACRMFQRQYILATAVDGLEVTDNVLEGGGRIKVGRPGRNISILRNTIRLVNDNGITFADRPRDECVGDICTTEDVVIADNTIIDAASVGIFGGADGGEKDHPGMVLRRIRIENNIVLGGFAGAGIRLFLPATSHDVSITGNHVEADRRRPNGGKAPAGIQVKRGTPSIANPTQRIEVSSNTVMSVGEFGYYNEGGIGFGGPIRDLTVWDNHVEAAGALHIARGGIWMSGEPFESVSVVGNRVRRAKIAMHIEAPATGLSIIGNELEESLRSNRGQITLMPPDGEVVIGHLLANHIRDGAGFGVFCSPGGFFGDLILNQYLGHQDMEEHTDCLP